MKLQKGEYYEITGKGSHFVYKNLNNINITLKHYHYKIIGKFITKNETDLTIYLYKTLKGSNIGFKEQPTQLIPIKEITKIKHITKEKMMVMMI